MMTGQLEPAIRALLKSVLLEVASEVCLSQPTGELEGTTRDTSRDRVLLRPAEAAELLAVSERHLHNMTRSGELPSAI
jgi:hypothetical protein